METIRKSIPLLLAFALLGSGSTRGDGRQTGVEGRVQGGTAPAPIAAARVWAYELKDLSLYKAKTDAQGNFRFSDLPAGLFKVIVYKAGFLPAMVMVTRETAQTYRFLDLELAARPPTKAPGAASDDFWALRAHVPADVLRSIQADEELRLASFEPVPAEDNLANFHTTMQAMTGVSQAGTAGDGQMADGRLGIAGRVGPVQLDISGRFTQFDPGTFAPQGVGGQARALSVSLETPGSSRIHLTSLNNRLINPNDEGGAPVDLEHYQVSWTQDVGQNGRSDFAAVYTTESNYHRLGGFDPVDIPEASTTWRVEGAYTMSLGDRSTLQTGLRYRERQFGLGGAASGHRNEAPGQSSVDLFGRGGVQVRPAILVEYGLYSTLSDGSLSLTPQGGVVLQLGQNWQASASASRRVYQDVLPYPDFLPALYEEGDLCEQGSEACYQVHLTRKLGDDNQVSLSALHRTVGETLRLYFSDQLMDRLESLYLVRGDELPELQFTVTRRLSPQVLTTLQSSIASGGGGTFVSASQQPYENRVRYMVTSLDTRFQSTSTGVFVAFHQLQQDLEPVSSTPLPKASLEHERLRLMLSQDLNILLDLAAEWAVQLNMELSRGSQQATSQSDDDVQRRFMGGIAVKF